MSLAEIIYEPRDFFSFSATPSFLSLTFVLFRLINSPISIFKLTWPRDGNQWKNTVWDLNWPKKRKTDTFRSSSKRITFWSFNRFWPSAEAAKISHKRKWRHFVVSSPIAAFCQTKKTKNYTYWYTSCRSFLECKGPSMARINKV